MDESTIVILSVWDDGDDPVAMVIEGAKPIKGAGRLFQLKPGQPMRVQALVGAQLLKHQAYKGVVRVGEIEQETGITYDVKSASAESTKLIADNDFKRFMSWVESQRTDRINNAKPAQPPPAAIQAIIDRRGYEPANYGIQYFSALSTGDPAKRVSKDDFDEMRRENAELRAQMKKLMDMLGEGEPEKKEEEAKTNRQGGRQAA
jgi:hypothetical protein